MTQNKIKWGIVGLGNIADQFCKDLLLLDDAEIYAVASRSKENALDFGGRYDSSQSYSSYQELFEDKAVDIVYIATPHSSHKELSIQAMRAGKHVLCEKPVAINGKDAQEMIAVSKETNRFFMEAFWSRFIPSIEEVSQKSQDGELGEIKYVHADFDFHVSEPIKRLVDLELGGGALLDVGVYPLFLSYLFLGMPEKIKASASFYASGADEQTSMILQYKNAQAILHCGFASNSGMDATISGTKGRVVLNRMWHETQSYSLIQNENQQDYPRPTLGKGYAHEAIECHYCLRQGKIESNKWSHQDSLNLMNMVDQVKKEIGLVYPQDEE